MSAVRSGLGIEGGVRRDEWLTPMWIIDAVGPFDLDPCAAPGWKTAKQCYTEAGLERDWSGRVWINPPYSETRSWLSRLAEHREGVALVFARTDARWFEDLVWNRADSVFFFAKRLSFLNPDGSRSTNNGGAPSVLASYGDTDFSSLPGTVVNRWETT